MKWKITVWTTLAKVASPSPLWWQGAIASTAVGNALCQDTGSAGKQIWVSVSRMLISFMDTQL